MSGALEALARAKRSARLARAAASVWRHVELPARLDRTLGRTPGQAELTQRHARAADALLALAFDLGGVSVKLCQVLATRADRFPPAITERLAACHDAAPARPFDAIRAVVEEELGMPLGRAFAWFSPTPVAAASLAQVHAARLDDGTELAVKVQYPEIAEHVRLDLANMRMFARLYERLSPQPFALTPLLDELAEHLSLELDFRREADNATRVRALFAGHPRIRVPRVDATRSSARVLTMEWVRGLKITDKAALVAAGHDLSALLHDLTHAYVQMVMAHGFFQADPHPGNLLVTPAGELVLLDFGLAKELPPGFGLGLFELMFSMMTLNESAMLRAFSELGFATERGGSDTFRFIARRMLLRLDNTAYDGTLGDELTGRLFEAVRTDPLVHIPRDFLLVGRVFGLLSGIAHSLGLRANLLAAMGAPQHG